MKKLFIKLKEMIGRKVCFCLPRHSIQACLILLLFVKGISPLAAQQSHLKLWYEAPAKVFQVGDTVTSQESRDIIAGVMTMPNGWGDNPDWLSALPLGNGSLGVMVFGGVNRERIQLNEESMWSGSPADNDNPNAFAEQEKIRQLLFDGKYKEATELTNKTQIAKGAGSGNGNGAEVPFGCFQTLGELWLDNGKTSTYQNYRRELYLDNATVRVSYTQNDVNYTREIFASHPDQVVVARFTADRPGSISFTASIGWQGLFIKIIFV